MQSSEFWRWFSRRSKLISSNPNNNDLINELDEKVSLTWPSLAWEIGPDSAGGWYFALSPNLNRKLLNQARKAIQSAPNIPGWKFYSARQKKIWTGEFQIETDNGIKHLNSSGWRFIFLQHTTGEKELVLITQEADLLDPDDRWQAAAIVIEGLIGEECLLSNIDIFCLESNIDDQLYSKTKPISLLPEMFAR